MKDLKLAIKMSLGCDILVVIGCALDDMPVTKCGAWAPRPRGCYAWSGMYEMPESP